MLDGVLQINPQSSSQLTGAQTRVTCSGNRLLKQFDFHQQKNEFWRIHWKCSEMLTEQGKRQSYQHISDFVRENDE